MIKFGNYKEEEEKNISRTYTKKQWKEFERESREYIDKIFNLANSSMVEQGPDTSKDIGSTPILPTENIDIA